MNITQRHSASANFSALSTFFARQQNLALLAVIGLVLCGCGTQVVREIDNTPPEQIAFEQSESQLLDIGIAVFDPNVPENYDERIERIILPEIRQAESQYMPYLTKNLLQSTGNWGAVRVVPRPSDAVDLTVLGKIIASTGEELILSMTVVDATGKEWFTKEYITLASKYGYEASNSRDLDPFQGVYKDFANDLLHYRQRLSEKEIENIRATAELKFAKAFSPDAFSQHIAIDENGEYLINRLPAENDPQLARVRQVREREYLFIDTLDEYYANFYRQVYPVYHNWRKATYNDAIEYKELRAKSKQKIIGGTAAILASVGSIYASDNGYVDASGVAGVGAGATLIISGIRTRQEAEQFADKLREVGSAAEAELVPTTIDLENQTVRLSGSVEEQYEQLRDILKRLYLEDLNLEADTGLQEDSQSNGLSNGTSNPENADVPK
jgi:hypothetical protein